MRQIQIKNCEVCKKPFEKKVTCSQFDWDNSVRYCSKSCAKTGKSPSNKGIPMSEDMKLHLSKVLLGRRCNTGRTHFKKGSHPSPATEFKKGQTSHWKGKPNPHFAGANNPRWKGGIYPQHLKERHSDKMKKIRLEVFKRDDYTCKNCGRKRKPKDRVILQIHHIKSFAIHKELRFDKNNIITLCAECHRKTDTYGKNL